MCAAAEIYYQHSYLGGHFGPEKNLAPLPPHRHSLPGALPPPTPPPRITMTPPPRITPPPLPRFLIKTGPPDHLLGHLLPYPRPRTEKNKKYRNVHQDANLIFQACLLVLRFFRKENLDHMLAMSSLVSCACISLLRRFRQEWHISVSALFT